MKRQFGKTTLELGERILPRMLEKDCQEVFRAQLRWKQFVARSYFSFL